MNYEGCFLTGFLTGQRIKRWKDGLSAGEGGVSFYDWAGVQDPTGILADPQSYAQYAAGLNPNLSLNSDNTLTWKPTVDDIPAGTSILWLRGNGQEDFRLSADSGWSGSKGAVVVTLNPDRRSWTLEYRDSWDSNKSVGLYYCPLIHAIDGTHNPGGFPAIRGFGNLVNGNAVDLSKDYGNANLVRYAGRSYDNLSEVYYRTSLTTVPRASALLDIYLPAFRVTPYATNALADDPRPGKLAGSVINETAQTFTNPLTGEVFSFTDYTYDYQTRTYTLTLEGGNKLDVHFGDDGIDMTGGLGGNPIDVQGVMYPPPPDAPIVVPADAPFNKTVFLSGLAAGMASRGA